MVVVVMEVVEVVVVVLEVVMEVVEVLPCRRQCHTEDRPAGPPA